MLFIFSVAAIMLQNNEPKIMQLWRECCGKYWYCVWLCF